MEQAWNAMDPAWRKLVDEYVAERIGQILEKRHFNRTSGEEDAVELLLSHLDNTARERAEELLSLSASENAGEYDVIYRAGFFDGLYLGHRAF